MQLKKLQLDNNIFNLSHFVLTARWTWVSRFYFGAKDNGSGGDNCRVQRRAKLQTNYHHQHTNTPPFYRPDALPVAQPTVSKHWREITKIYDRKWHLAP